ncbi:SBF complex DNA-binding subunit SWI4 KNAG_0B02250 [Huiozyma naganishii CBS 8797]|uniref:HTH APSES-type domain-containing protein n=1 Tax=Huiozyma naganishii (strain ATCC MYA-139 / BCRC 22969 / CBS 8797 / KCTC 17520 / NBRC 10181 / NCYC 3082 / Yp74L-3) TaxID=1071383 RepID=J7RUW9_HUIN7|nr:hypothetical protein KNAG_0B02250 [Kazachstania naganishii CBS 8797]CCK68667.1 hypothetical protein KNAG_0B02250 [Kazachstania naganishii CBS 8797]
MPITTLIMDAVDSNSRTQLNDSISMPATLPKITATSFDSDVTTSSIESGNLRMLQNPKEVLTASDLSTGTLSPPVGQPIIERATYSETDVYECYIKGSESRIVMRRTRDDWVNVTQIFKIGKYTKNHRTKILEKESQDLEHEKVQGGYGRFQGTWIPLESARKLVEKYGITNPVVEAILRFSLDPMNPPPKRTKNSILRKTSPGKKISSPSSYNKTPKKKNMSASGSLTSGNSLLSTTKKNSKRGANPSPLQNLVFQTPQQSYRGSTAVTEPYEVSYSKEALQTFDESGNSTISLFSSDSTPRTNEYSASQKPLQFYPVPTSLNSSRSKPANEMVANERNNTTAGTDNKAPKTGNNGERVLRTANPPSQQPSFVNYNAKNSTVEKRPSIKSVKPRDKVIFSNMNKNNVMIHGRYNTGKRNSEQQTQLELQQKNSQRPQQETLLDHFHSNSGTPSTEIGHEPALSAAETQQATVLDEEEYKRAILNSLSVEITPDTLYMLPEELYHPPPNLEINFELDDQGHTPLHWAAAMANIPLLKLLLALNSNALYCNHKGFNCITKAVFYNNNFKNGTFAELISILRICLITPDNNGRLPLHYLVELSVNDSKDPVVVTSYTEQILQELGKSDYRLLQMSLNRQDSAGNTPLHLAALNLNLSLFNKLCLLGSSVDMINNEKQTPIDILSQFNLMLPTKPDGNDAVGGIVEENSNELVDQPKQRHDRTKPIFIQKTPKNESARQFLSTHDDITNNSSSLNLIMEDLSHIDELVTSSVVKDPKIPQPILTSPMLQLKQIEENSGNLINSRNNNSMALKMLPLSSSPSPKKLRSGRPCISKLSSRIANVSKRLVDAIDEDMASIINEQQSMEENLKSLRKNLDTVKKRKDIIYSNVKVNSLESMLEKVDATRNTLSLKQEKFVKTIEKSQALRLATIVQEEEHNCLTEEQSPDILRDAVTLTVLQFKRRMWLKRLSVDITNHTFTKKIKKYKQLIGLTFENIDTKLEEIESELQTDLK